MRRLSGTPFTLLAVLLAMGGCRSERKIAGNQIDSAKLASRESRLEQLVSQPNSSTTRSQPVARWVLPGPLAEISGLALTADGRLLSHDDEIGRITEIDYRRGVIVKQFQLGKQDVHDDFEGITVANDVIFMLASNGNLYEFREGANGEHVDYTLHDTHLGHECEFEGIVYDPRINSLIFACKNVGTKALKNQIVFYQWDLQKSGGARISRHTIPMAQVIGKNDWKIVQPSDITLDPLSGNYVLVASIQKAIIEITPNWQVVWSRPVPPEHEQPEGVAITRDSLLIISDEAKHRPAVVTLYRWP